MIKIKLVFIVLSVCLLSSLDVFAKDVEMQIKLYASSNFKTFNFTAEEPTSFYSGKKKIGIAYKSQTIEINSNNNFINLKIGNKEFSDIEELKIENSNNNNRYKLKINNKPETEREYEGRLLVTSDSIGFKIINEVNLETYIAGVVEAEIGSKANVEMYKTKAIACRTYALKEFKKHKKENYYLCDMEHCQVYKGICKSSIILNAVKETSNLVIVDKDNYLISAAFHSNCGGVTCNSEDVWSLPTSYLKSIVDTFCLNQSRAKWEKKIALSDWINYLSTKYNYPSLDIQALRTAMNWSQYDRALYFANDTSIALKNIRADWELKSTFFSIQQQSDSVLFYGKGSGHGIGLCQQGAMRMAELNYTFAQIISFYYKDVRIINYADVKDKNLK